MKTVFAALLGGASFGVSQPPTTLRTPGGGGYSQFTLLQSLPATTTPIIAGSSDSDAFIDAWLDLDVVDFEYAMSYFNPGWLFFSNERLLLSESVLQPDGVSYRPEILRGGATHHPPGETGVVAMLGCVGPVEDLTTSTTEFHLNTAAHPEMVYPGAYLTLMNARSAHDAPHATGVDREVIKVLTVVHETLVHTPGDGTSYKSAKLTVARAQAGTTAQAWNKCRKFNDAVTLCAPYAPTVAATANIGDQSILLDAIATGNDDTYWTIGSVVKIQGGESLNLTGSSFDGTDRVRCYFTGQQLQQSYPVGTIVYAPIPTWPGKDPDKEPEAGP